MKKRIKKLSGWFNIPVPDPQSARRRKLLNVMLWAMAIGAFIALIVVIFTAPLMGTQAELRGLYLAIVLSFAGAAILYVLNRYVSGELASTLFTLLFLAMAALTDDPQQVVNGRGLFMFAIPIVAASVLLRSWASFVFAGLSSLVLVVIALLLGNVLPNVPGMLGFFMLATITWLSALSLERALERLHVANEALQRNEEQLEEMVAQRTRELREAQERLVRREKLAVLGQLAGGVGHELRNPLAVISNAVYFLNMVQPDADEKVKEYLEIISEETRNASKIISDLLDFARIKSVDRRQVAVSELVAQVLAKQPLPENVTITTEVPPDLPLVFVDTQQIGQVLTNLVTNSYQAMPDGGSLTIIAEVTSVQYPVSSSQYSVTSDQAPLSNSQSLISISLTDTGCGIPEENMDKLFEPLFTTKARGIGLGLAISRNLVEANEGSIQVESEEGKGSTFTILLPVDGLDYPTGNNSNSR